MFFCEPSIAVWKDVMAQSFRQISFVWHCKLSYVLQEGCSVYFGLALSIKYLFTFFFFFLKCIHICLTLWCDSPDVVSYIRMHSAWISETMLSRTTQAELLLMLVAPLHPFKVVDISSDGMRGMVMGVMAMGAGST